MKPLYVPCKILQYCSLLLIVCCFNGYSQESHLDSMKASFQEYTHAVFQEKVFVHTDKEFYLAGEIIWFKVYCTDASSHKPFNLTKVAYLEIINETQKAVVQARVSLKQGTGHASMSLPFSLTSGTYKIRAYTSWMKNFSPEYYFEKNIPIVNSLANLNRSIAKSQLVYSLQFFPEGGNLVEGILSKVAFKIADQYGKGIEGKGAVLNQKNDTLVKFQSFKFGMGNFFFTPEPGDTYKAFIQISERKTITSSLPIIYSQGYVMKLENTDASTISVSVQSNHPSAAASLLYLITHTRQVIQVAEAQNLREGKALFRIDKSKLGEGISHFTVFDENRIPVCERLYFKRPVQKLAIDANTSQQQYNIREKVTVDIFTSNATGNSEITNMSLSVFRLDSLQQRESSHIHSYLWLSSDLQGIIENPDYYFSQTSEEADQAIDNLMLTQGWRRFRWEDILQNKIPSFDFLPEHDGHSIPGSITDTRTGLPASNITAYLSMPGKRIQLYGATSDKKGKLLFNTKELYGQNEIVVQTNSEKDSLYRIDIQSPFSSLFSGKAFPEFLVSPQQLGLLADQSVGMQVQHIYASGKRNQFIKPILDSTAFYHTPDKTYRLDDFTRFPTVEEVVREYVQEVGVRKREGKIPFAARNQAGTQTRTYWLFPNFLWHYW